MLSPCLPGGELNGVRRFCDATLGLDVDRPLPDANGVGALLKNASRNALHRWHVKYVVPLTEPPVVTHDYRTQLHVTYCFLRDKRHIDFDTQEAADEAAVAAAAALHETRVRNAERELEQHERAVELNLLEVENALRLLMPAFEDTYGAAELLHVENFATAAQPTDDAIDDADEWEGDEEAGDAAPVALATGPRDMVLNVTVKTANIVDPSSDNEPLVRACRDGLRTLRGSHDALLRHLLATLTEGSVHWSRAQALMERARRIRAQAQLLHFDKEHE